MSVIALRPRHGTELLDAAFAVHRRMMRPLLTASALLTLPYAALTLLAPGLSLWYSVPVSIAGHSMLRAVIVVFVDDFLHGRPEDMGRAMRLTVRRAHRLIGAELQYVLLCLLGGMLLLLPGFLAFAALFAFPQAIMLEDSDVTTAMHRSSTLTQDRVLRSGGVLAMGMIIPFVLSLSVMAVTTFAAARMAWPPVVPRIGEVLATVAFSPFTSVFNTLLYFDLRVRKEGLDLERLVGTLADDTTTAEPGASPRAPAPAFVDSAS